MRSVEDLERDAFLADAECLAQLTQHPAWPRYEALLAKMRLGAMEEMAQAAIAEIPHWQGVAATLREVMERPHQIVASALAVVDEEKQRKAGTRQALDFAPRMELEDDL